MAGTTDQTGRSSRGVLLVNLGSPDSTSVADVRRYLHQFLMDRYVIDVPYLMRKMIVCLSILPTRPKQTAAAYRAIWGPDGSPLIAISRRVQAALQERLDLPVGLAMRYGRPGIKQSLDALLDRLDGNDPVVHVMPLYPHFAQATYKTVVEEIARVTRHLRRPVRLEYLPPFYEEPHYIRALADSLQESLRWDYDHVLFSYHGIPEKHVRKEDRSGAHCLARDHCCEVDAPARRTCYRAHVYATTRAVVASTGIAADKHSVAFQSRLGRDPWLRPFTDFEYERLAEAGVRRLLVVCASFVADCLETLEEIEIRGNESFRACGGEELRLVPCLNDNPSWIDTLEGWCRSGWNDPEWGRLDP